jgi:hypothetical protein
VGSSSATNSNALPSRSALASSSCSLAWVAAAISSVCFFAPLASSPPPAASCLRLVTPLLPAMAIEPPCRRFVAPSGRLFSELWEASGLSRLMC